jgi:hypothetical protein
MPRTEAHRGPVSPTNGQQTINDRSAWRSWYLPGTSLSGWPDEPAASSPRTTGLRWGELTELRMRDIDFPTRMLTVSRAVVEVNAKFHPAGGRFLVKDYPKEGVRGGHRITVEEHIHASPRGGHQMKTMQLADGRTLAYEDYGDPDGQPVVFTHGFGDSRLIRNPDDALTASLGVRVIAPDQPGVGGSSPKPGRKMIDWGPDVQELADHLGIDEFAVAGHSGGGPHTLAIAYHLPDRAPKGVLASPVGDFDDPFMRKQLVMRGI